MYRLSRFRIYYSSGGDGLMLLDGDSSCKHKIECVPNQDDTTDIHCSKCKGFLIKTPNDQVNRILRILEQ